MNKMWKKLLFCCLAVAGASAFSEDKPAEKKMERPPEFVKVGKVKAISVSKNRRYIGKISAVDDVSLIARVNGVIQKQNFSSGAFVKKGDLLFVIEDTTYVAAVKAAEAKLMQSKAEFEFAQKNLKRQSSLWKQKAVSESSYDEAVRQEATCRAALLAAEAALLDAKNNLSYTKIYAPINGKAGIAAVAEFNYVTPSTGTLVYIANMDSMNINFWITMRDYVSIFGGSFERLQKEAVVQIMLADGTEFNGEKKIVFVDNKVDKDTDSIRVRIRVKNDGMQLLPDALVSVRIAKKDGEKTSVPVSAIMNNGNTSYVYVLNAENIPAVRPVKLGDTVGSEQIILDGLKEGETVVIDGTHKVFPGKAVVPVGSK